MTASKLEALQARLQAHVLAGDASALHDVVAGGALDPAQRLKIYHHAYRARLVETLRDSFAHTLSYLGDEWFDALAGEFIELHPSTSSNLRWYGEGFAAWLAQRLSADAEVGCHPEVAEIAQLDWALRYAFDGPDAPTLVAADLSRVPPQAWETVVFSLHPTVALLRLGCNTLTLWHALDTDADVPEVALLPTPLDVVVWRFDERPHFRSVVPVEAQALAGLQEGASFVQTCELFAALCPDDNAAALAGGYLRRWLDDGLLSAFSV